MSSDEKALKPSERIAEIREERGRKTLHSNGEEYYILSLAQSVVKYLDEQAELLEAHTENETKAHKPNNCTCPCHNKHDTHYPL